MNYLAHLFLAGEKEDSIVGNYLGDFVKGNIAAHNLPDNIKQGIRMHRKVDALADQKIFSLLNENKISFSQRRYAGITFDLACDHFLAKHWQAFSQEQHHDFAEQRLDILKSNQQLFNHKARFVLERMENYQWLTNYQHLDFMEDVFYGIHKRFPKDNNINEAFMDLDRNYKLLEEICMDFIAELDQQLINQKR